ncbi:hypothetical protein [Azohydromonas aeria]|uniref:hypothetical protein n=1 Tax=Azohydromonas aeria TaxID=2590212 RepID=UPI0012F96FD0|nr:hypothetical protein [Azohydromonas aeria]
MLREAVPATPHVRFDGAVCAIRHEGVAIQMPNRPAVLPRIVLEVDFAPTQGTMQLRECAQRWRDMTAEEAALLQVWLEGVVGAVKAAAGREGGLRC